MNALAGIAITSICAALVLAELDHKSLAFWIWGVGFVGYGGAWALMKAWTHITGPPEQNA